MESCLAVEREIDKVVSKFSTLTKSVGKTVDEQIIHIGNQHDTTYNLIDYH